MTNSIKKTAPFFFVFLFTAVAVSAASSRIHLRYFYSADCSPCETTNSLVSELSKEFEVDGIWSGSENPHPLRFPAKKSTLVDNERQSIMAEPTLVTLKEGQTRQIINGARDILNSRTIIRGIEHGALTVPVAS
jgi:thiol-disulfide isomerase/thioredoxin